MKLALAYEYLFNVEKLYPYFQDRRRLLLFNLTRFEQNLLCMEEVQAIMSLGPFKPSNEAHQPPLALWPNVVMQDSRQANIRMIFLRLRMQKVDMDTAFTAFDDGRC